MHNNTKFPAPGLLPLSEVPMMTGVFSPFLLAPSSLHQPLVSTPKPKEQDLLVNLLMQKKQTRYD